MAIITECFPYISSPVVPSFAYSMLINNLFSNCSLQLNVQPGVAIDSVGIINGDL